MLVMTKIKAVMNVDDDEDDDDDDNGDERC